MRQVIATGLVIVAFQSFMLAIAAGIAGLMRRT